MLPYVPFDNNSWSFDIFYDQAEHQWKVKLAAGSEGYYQNIEDTIQAIENDAELNDDVRNELIAAENKKRIVLRAEDPSDKTKTIPTTLGTEPQPFLKYITVGIHSFALTTIFKVGESPRATREEKEDIAMGVNNLDEEVNQAILQTAEPLPIIHDNNTVRWQNDITMGVNKLDLNAGGGSSA